MGAVPTRVPCRACAASKSARWCASAPVHALRRFTCTLQSIDIRMRCVSVTSRWDSRSPHLRDVSGLLPSPPRRELGVVGGSNAVASTGIDDRRLGWMRWVPCWVNPLSYRASYPEQEWC